MSLTYPLVRWRDLANLAGALTLARLPLAAIFPFVDAPAAMAALYAAGLLTDVLDGIAARRLGQRSDTGALADGICDKTFHGVVALTLVLRLELAPLWWLPLWFSREVVQLTLLPWFLARTSDVPPRHANALGKATSALLSGACLATMLGWDEAAWGFTLATGACGLLAGLAYALRERA